jgi:hypothetical protein
VTRVGLPENIRTRFLGADEDAQVLVDVGLQQLRYISSNVFD